MRRGAGPEGLSAPSEDVVALASAWRTALASPRIERRAAPPAVSPSGGVSLRRQVSISHVLLLHLLELPHLLWHMLHHVAPTLVLEV